jgi:ketosteroid isomerase-like protein
MTTVMTEARLLEFATAWGKRDLETLMELFTDDCVYKASVGAEPGATYVGKAAVRAGWTMAAPPRSLESTLRAMSAFGSGRTAFPTGAWCSAAICLNSRGTGCASKMRFAKRGDTSELQLTVT